ncbi:UDP-glucuronic acid decarboxylase family protein [Oryzifoliimicrobium ureilyticus]|uniref:UDP-glucuronic acid decarboxylase family protein n=1 Tax=Oryzifoliimicrobium ureilyticus TaxID=3113724 RepID=UPI00307646A5
MTEKRRALVAGGAGFLGLHVCRRLLAEGFQVVCLDNLQTGRMTNIVPLITDLKFSFVHADVRGDLPDGDFDEIWNLACPASPPHYQIDPVDTLLINVLGMKNLLDLAVRTGARIFQASTSEIYGDPEVHPQTESYRGAVNTIGPRACYDEGKRAAETLCFDYHRRHGVEIKVARIFNTYGPHMDPRDGRVVSNFIVSALKGEPLELYGGGTQTRSFCYVDDLIDGFFRLMRSDASITGPVNIGNPGEFTVRELADIVLEMTGSRSDIIDKPLPKDDPLQRKPDITLAGRLLGWSPKISLREGLSRCIPYFAGEVGIAFEDMRATGT